MLCETEPLPTENLWPPTSADLKAADAPRKHEAQASPTLPSSSGRLSLAEHSNPQSPKADPVF